MNSEYDEQIEKLSSEITLLLSFRECVFLILPNDYLFNTYLIEKLNYLNAFNKAVLNENSELKFDKIGISVGSSFLVEIPKVNDETISFFSSKITKSNKIQNEKYTFLIKDPLSPKFIEFIYKESVQSSCIFISDRLNLFLSGALDNLVSKISTQPNGSISVDNFFEFVKKEKLSLGKLNLYFKNHKKETLKFNKEEEEFPLDEEILKDFLDRKGSELLAQLSTSIPINSIEIFFRSFIYIDGNTAIPVELNLNELEAFTKLPDDQVSLILQTAKSENFDLLSEGENGYCFAIPEYLFEWKDLKRWIENEETAFKHIKQLEALASDYFKSSGTLLSKDQIEQAVSLNKEIFVNYNWEEKYKIDKDLISSFILLSQKNLEEELKTQQKKRASLLKNSIRISIAVSIAFLFSSFTALLAYLERNSAIVQQELAIKSKEEAEEARKVAEKERQEAIAARENENLALKKAESERLLALDAKSQAEFQKKIALDALDQAEKSAIEASNARVVAEKNEKEATKAKNEAQINYETSEKLRNQQEARATALEALGYFANNNYSEGTKLVKDAYDKNINNAGFPLQSDIFNGILNAINQSNFEDAGFDLVHPAKLLSLSPNKDLIAVYTINGVIKIYTTPSNPVLKSTIKTGYIRNFHFLSSTEIICQDIYGKVSAYNLDGQLLNTPLAILPQATEKELIKVYGQNNIWLIKSKDGNSTFYEYLGNNGFIPLQLSDENNNKLSNPVGTKLYWVEGKDLIQFNPVTKASERFYTATTPISSVSWSTIHQKWIVGLESGQIISVDPKKEKSTESFTIHASKVSQLAIIPFNHDTELMISSGFDGGLLFFVFDKNIPISASISSRIKFQGHRSWITGFTIDEKNKIGYSISNDKTLKTWSLKIEDLFKNL